MRLFLLALLVALAVPANAVAGGRVSAFYYPWYGTSAADGSYQHWSQDGHAPPNDIASSYYPAIGLYSSSDKLVIDAQMSEIRAAGIDEIAVSWWGKGSPEDLRMPAIVTAAHKRGVIVAAHIEPYHGRTVASIANDIAYLAGHYGIKTFYVYQPFDFAPSDWADEPSAAAPDPRHHRVRADGARRRRGGRTVRRRLHVRHRHVRRQHLPSALRRSACDAPAVRAVGRAGVQREARQRRPGRQAAKAAARPTTRCGAPRSSSGADNVTITSFNEWHEGTQIEPAVARRRARYRYLSYDGAWGLHGAAAESAYLVAHALLVGRLPQDAARAAEDQGVVDRLLVDAAQLRVRRGRPSRRATRRGRVPRRPRRRPPRAARRAT